MAKSETSIGTSMIPVEVGMVVRLPKSVRKKRKNTERGGS